MRSLQHFDQYGESARRRGEDRRRRRMFFKALPVLLCFLALLGFAVSVGTAVTCFLLAGLAFLVGYPGLWLPRLPERVQAPQVVGVYFRAVLRGLEEDHGLLTLAGDGARFDGFDATAYGYRARLWLRESSHYQRWQGITPDITRRFGAFGVERVTVEELHPGSGRVEVKLYKRSPLDELHEVPLNGR